MITVAAACDARKKPHAVPDGIPAQLLGGCNLGEVITDDRQQSWFLLTPHPANGGDAILCRFHGDLTCGQVPGAERKEGHFEAVSLWQPALGAVPLVAVRHGGGTQYLEPFTWRVVRYFDRDLVAKPGLAWADGTIALVDGSLFIAAPGEELRESPSLAKKTMANLHVSRFGVVWVEYVGNGYSKLKVAPLDRTGIGPARELSYSPDNWLNACRDGDTFGLIDLHSYDVVMVNLGTGAVRRGRLRNPVSQVLCLPGLVAAPSDSPRHEPSALCSATGCQVMSTELTGDDENYPSLTLVDDAVMLVTSSLSTVVTRRIGEPPRKLKLAGDYLGLRNPQLGMVPSGAIAVFANGELLAFDHQGRLRPVTLTWSGPSPVPPRSSLAVPVSTGNE